MRPREPVDVKIAIEEFVRRRAVRFDPFVVVEARIVDHEQLKTKGSDKSINCEDAYQELGKLFAPLPGLGGRRAVTVGNAADAGADEPEVALVNVVGRYGGHG